MQKAGQVKKKHVVFTVSKYTSKDPLLALAHPASVGQGRSGHGKSSPQPEPRVDEAGRDQHGVDQGLLLTPGVALLLQHAEPPRDLRQLQGKQRGRCQPCSKVQDAGCSPEAWDSKR